VAPELIANIFNRLAFDFSFAWHQAQSCLFWQRPENQEARKKLAPGNLKILAEWEKDLGLNQSK